jgi:hypothetical protein
MFKGSEARNSGDMRMIKWGPINRYLSMCVNTNKTKHYGTIGRKQRTMSVYSKKN